MEPDVNALSERLALVEKEVASIRRGLMALDHSRASERTGAQNVLCKFQTDKAVLRRVMGDFLPELGIEGQPIKAEGLQARMAKAGLEANELSRDLIKAREE